MANVQNPQGDLCLKHIKDATLLKNLCVFVSKMVKKLLFLLET